MKNILVLMLMVFVYGQATETKNVKDDRILKKQIQIQMEKEKKYFKEQTFYQSKDYDFSGAEVNQESLKSIKVQEMDELDMDSVYD